MDKLPDILSTEALRAIIALFDDVSDVLFWYKDRRLRILALNNVFAERVNLSKEKVLGKTDADLYFTDMAQVFMADDRRVMRTGEPIRRKVELLANRFGGVEWRSTTKLPVRDARGAIVGTTGISRPLTGASGTLPPPYRAFGQIIDYCREHLSEGIGVEQMARHAGMSMATLARRFRQHLRLSPGEFLAHLRLSHACKLLADSPLNVTEIALECGYESPAAFSRAFHRQMQVSPSRYRRSFGT